MFDFPASPTLGQLYTPAGAGAVYQWDGEKWTGGIFKAKEPGFTMLDVAGLSVVDITVPTWAKMARITGRVWTGAAQYIAMRLSGDGTNFPAGAADYVDGGVVMNSGSGLYTPVNTQTNNAMTLTQAGDANQTTPTMIDTDINVVRPSTSQYYEAKHYGRSYSSAANAGHRGWLAHSYMASPIAVSGLRLATLRILNGVSGAPFAAGSMIHVQWIGDQIDAVPLGYVGEAPSDGAEYVRVNNVWRLKSQTIDCAGLTNVDIAVPTGAKMVHLYGNIWGATVVASNSLGMRCSLDGTNFLVGANDYHVTGTHYYSGTAGYAALGSLTYSMIYLAYNNDNDTLVPSQFRLDMTLVRANTSQTWYGIESGVSYQTAAGNGYNISQQRVGVMNTAGSGLEIKKLRFFHINGGAFGSPSYVDASWVY